MKVIMQRKKKLLVFKRILAISEKWKPNSKHKLLKQNVKMNMISIFWGLCFFFQNSYVH